MLPASGSPERREASGSVPPWTATITAAVRRGRPVRRRRPRGGGGAHGGPRAHSTGRGGAARRAHTPATGPGPRPAGCAPVAVPGAVPGASKPIPHAWRPLDLAVVTAAVLGGVRLAIRRPARPGRLRRVRRRRWWPSAPSTSSTCASPTGSSTRRCSPPPTARGGVGRRRPLGDRWRRAAIAGAAGFAAFYLVHIVVPKGMGFGDVRLAGRDRLRHRVARPRARVLRLRHRLPPRRVSSASAS